MRARTFLIAAGLIQAASVPASAQAQSQTLAFIHARLLPGGGKALDNATLIVRDGVILAAGTGVAVPAGAQVLDASGQTITAGLVAPDTTLGLVEVSSVAGTNDARPTAPDLSAGADVEFALNADSTALPVARQGGITSAIVLPDSPRGEGKEPHLLSGQAAVISLSGEQRILLRGRIAIALDLGEGGAKIGGGSRASSLVLLREAFDDARTFARNRAAYDRGALRPLSLSRADLEALQPVLDRRIPLVVGAHSQSDILQALDLSREQNLRIVIRGGEEAWRVAGQLAAAKVGVILNPTDNLPKSFEVLGSRSDSAALLRKAGVVVAITGNDSTHRVREMRFNAGMAVARGLTYDEAIDAITLAPAQLFGLDALIGSLQKGKQADFVIWDGDPLEPLTQARQVFVRGRSISLETRPDALAKAYQARHE